MKRISNVDLRLLRIFASVVESNGFTAAQLDLNISVSSISTYIAALEERLGVRLCQRGRTGFALTEKGAIIYREAKRLFATLDEFGVMAATVRGGRFNNRDHEVTIEVSVGPPAELQRGVLDGSLILRWPAFLPRSPNWSPSRFMAKSIDFYCGAGHRLFDRKAISLDDLAGCRIVARSYWCGVDLSRDWASNSLRHRSTSWKPGQPLFCRARIWASPGALCLALGRCGQVALHPSRKTELCGRLLQHKSLLPPVRQFMEDLRMSSARLFSRPGTRKRKSDGRDKTQPLRDGS